MEDVLTIVNSSDDRIEHATNDARWTEELYKNKNAYKWLKNSFGEEKDPFLQLEMLEEQLQEKYGKKPKQDSKMTYSEAVKTEKKHTESDIKEKSTKIGDFEKYTKGIGRKVMEKHGWKDGEGLGNGRKQGITTAIEAVGQTNSCKYGIGYTGENKEEESEEWNEVENKKTKHKVEMEPKEIATANRFL